MRSRLRARGAGSGVSVDHQVTAVLAEFLYQRSIDDVEARNFRLANELANELPPVAKWNLLDMACGCIELLAQEEDRDSVEMLRELMAYRDRLAWGD